VTREGTSREKEQERGNSTETHRVKEEEEEEDMMQIPLGVLKTMDSDDEGVPLSPFVGAPACPPLAIGDLSLQHLYYDFANDDYEEIGTRGLS